VKLPPLPFSLPLAGSWSLPHSPQLSAGLRGSAETDGYWPGFGASLLDFGRDPDVCRWQCAPKARITSGGRFHPDSDQDPPEKAIPQGEGGACLPLLLAYDKIYRTDILRHAYALVRANAGAPGTEGMIFAAAESSGLEKWLTGLREELVSKSYRPDPVRRMSIPKPDGGDDRSAFRRSGIGLVQTAAKLVLEPIFEADLEDNALSMGL
jgi:hypothetical protein